jgi:homoserine kinase type II
MAVYTPITDTDLRALTTLYGLASIPTAHPIAEGVENTNYLLHYTHPDDSPARAILTVFEVRVEAKDLPFFLRLKEHLRGKGIMCPLPYRTITGEMTIMCHGKMAAMVSFLEGASVLHPTAHHCHQAGETLARLHVAGNEFPAHRTNSMSFDAWATLRERIAIRKHAMQPPELLARIDTELVYAREHFPRTLPSGVIHGDFFPNNVFFDAEEQLSGVIDFYFACNDLLAYDLSIVVNAWCFDSNAHFNTDAYAALLAGYESVRRLSDAEKTALPALLRISALRFLLTRLHDLLYHDANALVTPHDPLHYLRILDYHA